MIDYEQQIKCGEPAKRNSIPSRKKKKKKSSSRTNRKDEHDNDEE